MNARHRGRRSGLLALAVIMVLHGALGRSADRSRRWWQTRSPQSSQSPTPSARESQPTASYPAPAKPAAPAGNGCEKASSSVTVEKCGPYEVQVDETFSYTLVVHNPCPTPLLDVRLTEVLPEGFKLQSTAPRANGRSGSRLTWNLGTLQPRQTREVTLTGTAVAPGAITNQAFVTHSTPVTHRLRVNRPKLQLNKSGPAEALSCDPIAYTLTVTNVGSGIARNVVIEDTLPRGMTAMDGRQTVRIPVGDLGEGQSKRATLEVKVAAAGTYLNPAVATGDGDLRAEASCRTVVREPKLAIEKSGPATAYLDHPARYTITVSNVGDGVAENTVLVDDLPANVTLKAASRGAEQEDRQPGSLGGRVRWGLGDLRPGDARQVTLVLVPTQIGQILNTATATARCCKPVSDQAVTRIVGISAILLEVVDVNDPVPVGDFTEYVITATNQGSSTGTNVRITCEIEETMQFIDATGATRGVGQGSRIVFDPLPQIPAREKATWRVKVKAVAAGDVRFKVQMTSDQLGRPVIETEATNFFE